MTFSFKLDPVLEARRRAEQAEQRAVAQIERQRLAMEQDLRRQQAAIAEGKHTLRGSLIGSIDMTGLRLRAGSSLHMLRRAQQIVLQLAGLHKQLETARGRLIEATRSRRALELLRERRYRQWKAAIEKAETNALDELAVMRAGRRGKA